MPEPANEEERRLLADEQQARIDGDAKAHRDAIEAQKVAGMDMRSFRFHRDDEEAE